MIQFFMGQTTSQKPLWAGCLNTWLVGGWYRRDSTRHLCLDQQKLNRSHCKCLVFIISFTVLHSDTPGCSGKCQGDCPPSSQVFPVLRFKNETQFSARHTTCQSQQGLQNSNMHLQRQHTLYSSSDPKVLPKQSSLIPLILSPSTMRDLFNNLSPS